MMGMPSIIVLLRSLGHGLVIPSTFSGMKALIQKWTTTSLFGEVTVGRGALGTLGAAGGGALDPTQH